MGTRGRPSPARRQALSPLPGFHIRPSPVLVQALVTLCQIVSADFIAFSPVSCPPLPCSLSSLSLSVPPSITVRALQDHLLFPGPPCSLHSVLPQAHPIPYLCFCSFLSLTSAYSNLILHPNPEVTASSSEPSLHRFYGAAPFHLFLHSNVC